MRTKSRSGRLALRTAVAGAAVAAGVCAAAQPAQAGGSAAASQPLRSSTLGSLDFNAYCRSMGDTGARLTADNAYGWICSAAGKPHPINVDQGCQWQYSAPNARAAFSDLNNPCSWYCYM